MGDLQGRLIRLRHLLHATEGELPWESVMTVFRTWPANLDMDVGLSYALGLLDVWPDDARTANPSWVNAVLSGGDPPRAWQLARSVKLPRTVYSTTLRTLLWSPHMAHISHLDATGLWLDDEAAELISRAPHLGALKHLDLRHNQITSEGLGYLLETTAIPAGAKVDVRHNPTSVVNLLDRQPPAFQVNFDLGLDAHRVTLSRLREVCQSPLFACALSLELPPGNDLGGEILTTLLQAQELRHLTTLSLPSSRLDNVGPPLRDVLERASLDALHLQDNRLTADDLRPLGTSSQLATLRELDLGANPIGDAGLRHLLRAGSFARLERLNLANCHLTAGGIRELAGYAHFGALTHLELTDNNIGNDGLRALLNTPLMSRLRYLGVARAAVTDVGLEALLAEPNSLRQVYIGPTEGLSQWITAEFSQRFINEALPPLPDHTDFDDIPF